MTVSPAFTLSGAQGRLFSPVLHYSGHGGHTGFTRSFPQHGFDGPARGEQGSALTPIPAGYDGWGRDQGIGIEEYLGLPPVAEVLAGREARLSAMRKGAKDAAQAFLAPRGEAFLGAMEGRKVEALRQAAHAGRQASVLSAKHARVIGLMLKAEKIALLRAVRVAQVNPFATGGMPVLDRVITRALRAGVLAAARVKASRLDVSLPALAQEIGKALSLGAIPMPTLGEKIPGKVSRDGLNRIRVPLVCKGTQEGSIGTAVANRLTRAFAPKAQGAKRATAMPENRTSAPSVEASRLKWQAVREKASEMRARINASRAAARAKRVAESAMPLWQEAMGRAGRRIASLSAMAQGLLAHGAQVCAKRVASLGAAIEKAQAAHARAMSHLA